MCCSKEIVGLGEPVQDVRRAANVLHRAASELGAEGNGILFAVEGLYAVHRQLESRYHDLCQAAAFDQREAS